ncbi:MAG: hypothetical protein I4O48_08080 [Ralstonia sp.]|nr:hypothetical protein [Ralstonia pickettii]MCL6468265.1 hypothetical protein [Ralstonia sp.]
MRATNHVPPEQMSAAQRRGEIAVILAMGLVRLREADSPQSADGLRESEFVLGFAGEQSVHVDSNHAEKELP